VKITHLKNYDKKLELEFYNFFLSSKPYDLDHIRSPHLRRQKIESLFSTYCKTSQVYTVEEDSKLKVAAFVLDGGSYLDVIFIFGVSKNFGSVEIVRAARSVLEYAMQSLGKNYIKSQIRRKHKVKSYKKWLERYDKKLIIFNDENNTVVWCNRDIMTIKFKVVGTNKATAHLMGRELLLRGTKKIKHGLLREFSDGEDTYLLDEKGIDFLSKAVMIYGHLSDNKQNVGNISLKFIPNE
jgi:hypothetical protein|tara:strand:- start:1710 stop:2426 length:717 start_codon:yes stop_codon:yes gene_type:complete